MKSRIPTKGLGIIITLSLALVMLTSTKEIYATLFQDTGFIFRLGDDVPLIVQSVWQVTTPNPERVDVLVNSSIWTIVQTSVIRYATDLSATYSVYVYSVTYGTPEQVRTFLQGHLTLGLKGCLLVGDIPYATYYIPAHDTFEHWDADTFPCDLFYMDLNGVWTDTNGDGAYESHTGDTAPEIWVGRVKPTGMGDQATLINNYFDKNHAFRTGTLSVPKRGLVYVDDEWASGADSVNLYMRKIYANTTEVKDNATTTASDYKSRLGLGYEWVHLRCHGSPQGHQFKIPSGWENWVYVSDYVTINPRTLFYMFRVCRGARFNVDNYLAGVSVFKTSYGLLAIGSTKVGGMDYFEDFYTQVATSKDIGTAFRSWFISYGKWQTRWPAVDYSYGMTVIGDPTLTPNTVTKVELLYDDGVAEISFNSAANSVAAVRFSISSEIQLLMLEYWISARGKEKMNKVNVHVLDATFRSVYFREVTPSPGWFVVDISDANVVVSGDFYVGFQWTNDGPPYLGVDRTPPYNRRSYLGSIGSPGMPKENENYMIRVFASAPFDFSLSNSGGITATQGGSGFNTITVTLTSGLSQTVGLSASGLPSGATASLNPASGIPSFASVCTISTLSSTPTGSHTIIVTGSRGGKVHNTTFTLTVKPPISTITTTTITEPQKCIIATAAFGSELAPEVQTLRTFRDSVIVSTQSGRAFMKVFSRWYYSFSPEVANVISENQLLRDVVKTSLYPLIGVLSTSASAQSVFAFNSELATIMAGLVATALVGLIYLFPPMLLISTLPPWRLRSRRKKQFGKSKNSRGCNLLGNYSDAANRVITTATLQHPSSTAES